jgi:hypothetical protein
MRLFIKLKKYILCNLNLLLFNLFILKKNHIFIYHYQPQRIYSTKDSCVFEVLLKPRDYDFSNKLGFCIFLF